MKSVNFDDTVFWSINDCVLTGTVRGMYKDTMGKKPEIMIEIVNVRKIGTTIKSDVPQYIALRALHPTEKACRNEIENRHEAARDIYRKKIHDISDLVQFMLNTDVVSKEHDPRAREVAIEMANKLLPF